MQLIRKKNNNGFTLVEVIVATMMLTVAIVPLLATFITSSRMNQSGRQKEQAMIVAENIMEGVKSVGVDNTYKWAVSPSAVQYSVIPSNADGSGVGTSCAKYTKNKTFDLSSVKKDAAGGTLSTATAVKVDLTKYEVNISGILLGKGKYNAKVSLIQEGYLNPTDTGYVEPDLNNIAAYAFKSDYSSANLSIIKYYNVYISVYPTGGSSTEPLAEYSGTVATKS